MSMKGISNTVPGEYAEHWMTKLASITWQYNGRKYTWAPTLDTLAFMRDFPVSSRISGLLECSGSSWCDKAYLFCVSDCFDPPLYVQFASSFEDANESYIDNDQSLLIDEVDQKDYAVDSDSPTCGFNSDGQPVDTEGVRGDGPLTLVSMKFKPV